VIVVITQVSRCARRAPTDRSRLSDEFDFDDFDAISS